MRALVVCLGNICRSPIGEGLLKHHAALTGLPLTVDSAGTSGWHQGDLPDERSIAVMKQHGHDIRDQRSRALTQEDLYLFDFILVMDEQNEQDVLALGHGTARVARFVPGQDVPDPYFGGTNGFETVYTMVDQAAQNWIKEWHTTKL